MQAYLTANKVSDLIENAILVVSIFSLLFFETHNKKASKAASRIDSSISSSKRSFLIIESPFPKS